VGFDLRVDAAGRLEAVEVTWAYDALYSLLVTEEMGLDADGDMVLTEGEERALTGFDMNWIEGFEGDLEARLEGQKLALSGPKQPTARLSEGRIVTTHLRRLEVPQNLAGTLLTLKPFDPTYYTAYEVTLAVTVSGGALCDIEKQLPDLDAETKRLQEELAALGRDESTIEMGFPEVGENFATEVQVRCAGV
jgi:ABC-type uncharacterized transport system substrate-binding protein